MHTRRQLPDEQISTQGDTGLCAAHALRNLYRLMELEPPTMDYMAECFHSVVRPDGWRFEDGMTAHDMYQLLYSLDAPFRYAVGAITRLRTARNTLIPYLDEGGLLAVGYRWRLQGELMGHLVAVEGYTSEGLKVLCSGESNYLSKVVDLNTHISDEEMARLNDNVPAHGCRRILPINAVCRGIDDVGLDPSFLIVWPDN